MKKLRRIRLILDMIYWIATGVREIANATGFVIETYRKLRKGK